jgi:hypothetical protein
LRLKALETSDMHDELENVRIVVASITLVAARQMISRLTTDFRIADSGQTLIVELARKASDSILDDVLRELEDAGGHILAVDSEGSSSPEERGPCNEHEADSDGTSE